MIISLLSPYQVLASLFYSVMDTEGGKMICITQFFMINCIRKQKIMTHQPGNFIPPVAEVRLNF